MRTCKITTINLYKTIKLNVINVFKYIKTHFNEAGPSHEKLAINRYKTFLMNINKTETLEAEFQAVHVKEHTCMYTNIYIWISIINSRKCLLLFLKHNVWGKNQI